MDEVLAQWKLGRPDVEVWAMAIIGRINDPDDGRQVLVTLTDQCLATVDAALIDRAENERQLVDAVGKSQRRQLVELLRTLDDDVSAWQ